jgi:hypothetical protein
VLVSTRQRSAVRTVDKPTVMAEGVDVQSYGGDVGHHKTHSHSPVRRAASHVGLRVVDTLIAAGVSALVAWAFNRVSQGRRSASEIPRPATGSPAS